MGLIVRLQSAPNSLPAGRFSLPQMLVHLRTDKKKKSVADLTKQRGITAGVYLVI